MAKVSVWTVLFYVGVPAGLVGFGYWAATRKKEPQLSEDALRRVAQERAGEVDDRQIRQQVRTDEKKRATQQARAEDVRLQAENKAKKQGIKTRRDEAGNVIPQAPPDESGPEAPPAPAGGEAPAASTPAAAPPSDPAPADPLVRIWTALHPMLLGAKFNLTPDTEWTLTVVLAVLADQTPENLFEGDQQVLRQAAAGHEAALSSSGLLPAVRAAAQAATRADLDQAAQQVQAAYPAAKEDLSRIVFFTLTTARDLVAQKVPRPKGLGE